jgi:sarcosine oxidase subunit beta
MVKQTADAVVIGAGVIGCSIALELARDGRDVIVVDKSSGIGHGSTSASSGIVRFHYSTQAGVALAWESVHGWRDWAGHLGFVDPAGLAALSTTGILVLDHQPDASRVFTALFDQVGVPWEYWDSSAIIEHVPPLDAGRFGPPVPVDSEEFYAEARGSIGGSFTPDAGYVGEPQLAAHNLAISAQHFGARFLTRREVQNIDSSGDRRWRCITSEGDQVAADIVVNAAGPWSSRVNAIAGVGDDFTVTSRPLRQEVHDVMAPRGFAAAGSVGITVADPDLGIYLRPAANGGILVGGMEPECDELEWLDDPDEALLQPTSKTFEAQILRAARRLPGLAVPNRPTGIAGVYDATNDWTPIYDRTAADGYYVAMGTSGNQFKNAPVVGMLMQQLISAVEGGRDHDRDPVHLSLPRTGQVVDLSAYSRRRRVAAGAPSSVMG